MRWRHRLRNLRRRYGQWLEVLRLEHREAGRLPWLTMFRAVLTGPVPAWVWRQRMRRCMTCPLYSTVQPDGTTKRTDRLHLCKSTHPKYLGTGCHCAVNISAMTANPYGKGCFGRTISDRLGWGAHPTPWWSVPWRVICFILDIRY